MAQDNYCDGEQPSWNIQWHKTTAVKTEGKYSTFLYSGSDLSRHGSACQPHLLSMIRAKDLLLRRSQPWANSKKATKMETFPLVTCVSCLLLLSFSVRELSCALILSLALCSSLAESTASSFALRSTSMWRRWDSIRCCREEEEQ